MSNITPVKPDQIPECTPKLGRGFHCLHRDNTCLGRRRSARPPKAREATRRARGRGQQDGVADQGAESYAPPNWDKFGQKRCIQDDCGCMPIDCPSSEAKPIDLKIFWRKRPSLLTPIQEIFKLVDAANGQANLPYDLGCTPLRGPAAHQYKSVVQCLSCRHPAEPDPVALPGPCRQRRPPQTQKKFFFA